MTLQQLTSCNIDGLQQSSPGTVVVRTWRWHPSLTTVLLKMSTSSIYFALLPASSAAAVALMPMGALVWMSANMGCARMVPMALFT